MLCTWITCLQVQTYCDVYGVMDTVPPAHVVRILGFARRLWIAKTKTKKKDCLPWSWIDQKPTEDNLIQQTAWKDNALVLMMSTIHEASDTKTL